MRFDTGPLTFCDIPTPLPSDVLGSAVGWAATVQFVPGLSEQFETFRHRQDVFSLGVCNGCQLMALLGWVGAVAADGELGSAERERTVLRSSYTMRTKCAISDTFARACAFAYCASVAQYVYSLSAEHCFRLRNNAISDERRSDIAHLVRIVCSGLYGTSECLWSRCVIP